MIVHYVVSGQLVVKSNIRSVTSAMSHRPINCRVAVFEYPRMKTFEVVDLLHNIYVSLVVRKVGKVYKTRNTRTYVDRDVAIMTAMILAN